MILVMVSHPILKIISRNAYSSFSATQSIRKIFKIRTQDTIGIHKLKGNCAPKFVSEIGTVSWRACREKTTGEDKRKIG